MKKLLFAAAAVLVTTIAWASGPIFAPDSRLPERVVPLGQLNPVSMRITNCNVIGSFATPQVSRTCDRALGPIDEAIVLREVQIHTSPYAEQPGQLFWGAQCWVRVLMSEDGMDFAEIAKFSWPTGDYHGINHVLPVPIGLRPGNNAVMRAIVGITSIAEDECRVEVKIYSTER